MYGKSRSEVLLPQLENSESSVLNMWEALGEDEECKIVTAYITCDTVSYLSGAEVWGESVRSVAATAWGLRELSVELARGSWRRWRVSRAHLWLDVFTYSSESPDITWTKYFILIKGMNQKYELFYLISVLFILFGKNTLMFVRL